MFDRPEETIIIGNNVIILLELTNEILRYESCNVIKLYTLALEN
jgi:hypothetical protein